GDYAKAQPLYEQGMEISRRNLELTAAVQSERQQLAMAQQLRAFLDNYLALAPRINQTAAATYRPVLAWKGAVFVRQQRLRLERQSPALAADVARLRQMAGRLAALVLSAPAPQQEEGHRRKFKELSEQTERLERELAGRSTEFRQQQAAARLTPTELQSV